MLKVNSEINTDESVYNRIMSCCTSNDPMNVALRSMLLEQYGIYNQNDPGVSQALSAEGESFYNFILNGINYE